MAGGREQQVRGAVQAAIAAVNQQLPAAKHLQSTDDTSLAGLDSLGLVTLIVALDGKLREAFAAAPSLTTDESFFSRSQRPAKVADLVARVTAFVEAAGG
ncbi:MAG: hypothetical protein ACAI38_18025 [Myxococcota bacterium]|nr:hypothetical protein [Myxococcota bacterium]